MPEAPTSREDLAKRQLPEMTLSDGSVNSMTPPAKALPADMNPTDRAQARFRVEGNAIVVGGLGVLGSQAARALLEHGASGVALFDVNSGAAGEEVNKLCADFPQSRIIIKAANVTDEESVSQAMEETVSELGNIDVLCNFAGVVGCTHAAEMSLTEWRRCIDVNTTGSFVCAQAAARQMMRQGTGGSIVLVASISGHRVNFPQPQVAYNTSKAGVIALVKSLAAEWASSGIRVNSISPGYMDTILNEGPGLERARRSWASRNPMGRMGSPVELTGPLVMLCSKFAGAYITGTDLVVDGGGIVF